MLKRRIKAFVLTAVMAVSVFACFVGVNDKTATVIYGSEYEKQVALMKSGAVSDVSVQGFSTDSASVTPGYDFDSNDLNNVNIPVSALNDITALQYYYETDTYAYGITADGSEVISLRKANGQKYDMLSGAGKVQSNNTEKVQVDGKDVKARIIEAGKADTFTEGTDENGNKTLTVNYQLSGVAVDEYNNSVSSSDATDLAAPSIKTVYTFYEGSIGVRSEAKAESNKYTFGGSSIVRTHLCGYHASNERVKVNSKWIYPDNMDEPYQDFECLAFIYSPDKVHRMYTFRRGEELSKYYAAIDIRGKAFSMNNNEGAADNLLDSYVEYTLVMADASSEKQSANYLSLFRSRDEDFAAGIAVAQNNTERSTIFTGNTAKLNINVTNLKNKPLTYSLRYDVRDYYGNIVDAGLFIDNTLPIKGEANRLISITGNYGMYYLNLYAISENTTYKECYPFALLEEYDYKYNSTSPFGISTVTAYTGADPIAGEKYDTPFVYDYSQFKDLANLSAKIGISNARSGGNKYKDYMSELGIDRFMCQMNPTFESLYREELDKLYKGPVYPIAPVKNDYTTDGVLDEEAYNKAYTDYVAAIKQHRADFEAYYNSDEAAEYRKLYEEYKAKYIESVKSYADTASEYATAIEFGNEMNIFTLKDDYAIGVDELYDYFYRDTFLPSYEYVTKNYPNLKYIPTSFSAAESGWINRLCDDEKGNPIWDKFDICSIHIYGQPWMPDSFGARKGGSNNLWNIEDGMIRMENACKTYGDKEVWVTEIGYPTPPESAVSVGLRTQADYTARIGAICLGHGVDVIQFYCMSDRTGYYTGFNNSNGEWNFGLFYEADFFEVIKPKPAGIAYANMTRQLESYKHNSGRIDTYDEGNLSDGTYSYNVAGVRAFRFDTELYGEVVMAYSNKEVLPNAKKNALSGSNNRAANLTWNTQWSETDETEFTALGDTVRVVDVMGNETVYTPDNSGKVTIPLTGSPVYIYGV